MSRDSVSKYLKYYVPLRRCAGFCLPVFSDADDVTLYVQIPDEYNNFIARFGKIDIEQNYLKRLPHENIFGVGDLVAYCFLNKDDIPMYGNLNQLRNDLFKFISMHPEDKEIALQVAEVVGTNEQKRTARREMKKVIEKMSGKAASNTFYFGSVLHSALWDVLISASPSSLAASKILKARSRLGVRVERDGSLNVDLSALDPEDYSNLSQDTIKVSILEQFDPSVVNVDAALFESVTMKGPNKKVLDEILKKINRTQRQEDRISILLNILLHDPSLGLEALRVYSKDRAAMASSIIADIRANVNDKMLAQDVAKFVASRLPVWLKNVHPFGTEKFLVSLCAELGSYPDVNRYLFDRLSRSRSSKRKLYIDLRENLERDLVVGHIRNRSEKN